MPHTGRLISGLEMEPMKALVTSPLYLLCPSRFMSAPVLDHSNGPLPSYVLEVGGKGGCRAPTSLCTHCVVSISPEHL